MKILVFLTQFYKLNGAERLGVELAEELNKRRIHADILSMYSEDLFGVPEAKQDLLRRGIPVVHFLGMKIHPSITSLFSAIRKLRRLIYVNEYDIVETSMLSPAVLASWAVWGLGAKHVKGIHDVFRKDRFNSMRHKIWRCSMGGNRCARFYAISNIVRDLWVKYTNTPAEKTQTIYNSISDDFFKADPDRQRIRDELGIPQDARIVLFVGRLMMRKGIDTILDALVPILHDENLYVLYVGEWYPPEGLFQGEANLQDAILSRIDKWGMCDRVFFLGRRKDVPRIMASSDLLVHPARTEGFGLVLAEAMAAGLPVVASDVDGIPEVLAGTDSMMVSPDDPRALREAVLRTLSREADEADRAVEKGRKRAEDFRVERRIDTMLGLFNELVENHS